MRGLSPSPAATWGSPTCACSLTALPDEHLAPRPAGHGVQPEELMLGGPPCPDTVVVRARAVWLCEAMTNVSQPRTPTPTAAPGGALGQGSDVPLMPYSVTPSSAISASVFKSLLWLSLPHSRLVASGPAQTSAIHFYINLSLLSPSALFWVMAFLCSGSSVLCPHCASSALTAQPVLSSCLSFQNFPVKCPVEVCTGQQHFPHPT